MTTKIGLICYKCRNKFEISEKDFEKQKPIMCNECGNTMEIQYKTET